MFQILGHWSYRLAMPAGPDLGLWPDVCQREHCGHGLPVYHFQLPARNVHLHLPLCAAEKGTESLTGRAVWNQAIVGSRFGNDARGASPNAPKRMLLPLDLVWWLIIIDCGCVFIPYRCVRSTANACVPTAAVAKVWTAPSALEKAPPPVLRDVTPLGRRWQNAVLPSLSTVVFFRLQHERPTLIGF